jgi:hypothetical protein
MRSGVWLVVALGVASSVPACSGGYPLPPTRCDEWCDATKGESCPDYYSPASCVSQCEQEDRDRDSCAAALDAVIACYRKTPSAAQARCASSYSTSDMLPCNAETAAHYLCMNPPGTSPGYPL